MKLCHIYVMALLVWELDMRTLIWTCLLVFATLQYTHWWCLFIAADQTKIMQDQMSGAAMSMPQDPSKAFKVYH